MTCVRRKDSRIVPANVDGSGEKELGIGESGVWSPEGARLACVREGSLCL